MKAVTFFLLVLSWSSLIMAQVNNSDNKSIDPMWLFVPEATNNQLKPFKEPVLGSLIDNEIHFVELLDGVYAPIGIRTPSGEGPFPTIVFAHMNGGLGIQWIREWTNFGSGTLERFLDQGYAVVWMRYRAEVDTLYGETDLNVRQFQGRQRFTRGPLEYEDAISILEYIRSLPSIDPSKLGWVGVSHGGEMLMKVASEYDGLAVGVATEPASMDFIAKLPEENISVSSSPQLETMSEENTTDMQIQAVEDLRKAINIDLAKERISSINTPIYIIGRDRDHNQSVFRLNYELLEEGGKDVKWSTYDHENHGFIFLKRNLEGDYIAHDIQDDAIKSVIDYIDRYLK